jgi:hypothetical protein
MSYQPQPGYPPVAGFGGARPSFDTYNAGATNTTSGLQVNQSGVGVATTINENGIGIATTNVADSKWRVTVQDDNKLVFSFSTDGGKTFNMKMRISPGN